MSDQSRVLGGLVLRNTALSLTGQIVSSLVAVAAIPYVLRGLGVERFGILSIVWVLLGYFSLFDVGLGRATTKYVADAMGKNDPGQIPPVMWTSLVLQLALGILGGLALAAGTPLLVEQILTLSPALVPETRAACYLLSFVIPVVIASANLRGVLEAAQRFDLINAVKVPASCLTVLMPALGVWLELDIVGITELLILVMVATAAAYLLLCFRVFPILRRFSLRPRLMGVLIRYGGWITVSNVLVAILLGLDRFLVGALVSVTALGYYTAPYELTARLQIIPGNFGLAFFPAVATLAASSNQSAERLYVISLRYLLLIMGAIAFAFVLFARNILEIWLGAEFAKQGTLVLQILAIGIMLNALAQVPAHLLDAMGRPDLRAKIFLSYTVVYAAMAWLLITRMGIVGAALAWSLRALIELVLFLAVSAMALCLDATVLAGARLLRGMLSYVAVLVVVLLGTMTIPQTGTVQAALGVLGLVGLSLVAWRDVLDGKDRTALKERLLDMRDTGGAL